MSQLFQLIIAALSASFFVASNVVASHWAKTSQHWLWLPIFGMAATGYILFGVLIKQSNLSISAGLVDTIIVIGSILIGTLFLQDALTTRQTIGLVFAILAVIFVM